MNKNNEKRIDRLPDAELDVMLVLWNTIESLKTSQIAEVLNEQKNWSMSTVQSLLARLAERGFVSVKKELRLKYYSPAISEELYRSKETKTFLERLHGNSFKSLIATLANDKTINTSDIDEIAEIIKKAGNKNA